MVWVIQKTDKVDIYLAALNRFGKENQVLVCLEELAELQHALCKVMRHGLDEEKLDKLAEEIADVEITLEQMRLAFKISTQVEKWKTRKLNRLQERIWEIGEARKEG